MRFTDIENISGDGLKNSREMNSAIRQKSGPIDNPRGKTQNPEGRSIGPPKCVATRENKRRRGLRSTGLPDFFSRRRVHGEVFMSGCHNTVASPGEMAHESGFFS